jgi:hypothetical protein
MIVVETNPYKSIVVLNEDDEPIMISEGDKIEFTVESTGEIKKGIVTKFNSKNEKLKLQMVPDNETYEQIWPIIAMSEGSLKLVEDSEDKNE